jgi:hypothetical protein
MPDAETAGHINPFDIYHNCSDKIQLHVYMGGVNGSTVSSVVDLPALPNTDYTMVGS